MPDLDTKIHLQMLQRYKGKLHRVRRVLRAIKREVTAPDIYGLEWGEPEVFEPLVFVRDRYIVPYVKPDQTALEIGPGGGRWTRYLLNFKQLYAVDYHEELLTQLKKVFDRPNIAFVKNDGTDFPGIPEQSIDYLFSFGVFVHLDLALIEAYLANMKPLLKPTANVVIQYSDMTKIMGQINTGFSKNTPEIMRKMVLDAGYTILEEDLTTLWHSSIIRFTL